MDNVSAIVLPGLLMLVGAMIQTAFGFGLAVVAAPILVILHPELVPGPLIASALLLCIAITGKNWRALDMAGLTTAFAGRIPGAFLGAWILLWVSQSTLAIIVGSMVLIAVLVSLGSLQLMPTKTNLFWASVASGFMATTSSVGGPPMALVMQHGEAARIRANLSAYFIYGCFTSILILMFTGQFGTRELWLSLELIPWTLAGFFLATRLPWLYQMTQIRPVILGLCAMSGLTAIISGLV